MLQIIEELTTGQTRHGGSWAMEAMENYHKWPISRWFAYWTWWFSVANCWLTGRVQSFRGDQSIWKSSSPTFLDGLRLTDPPISGCLRSLERHNDRKNQFPTRLTMGFMVGIPKIVRYIESDIYSLMGINHQTSPSPFGPFVSRWGQVLRASFAARAVARAWCWWRAAVVAEVHGQARTDADGRWTASCVGDGMFGMFKQQNA